MFGSLSHQPPGPVKMLTALGWWWHTPHDTAEHIDLDNLVRDASIILRVLWRLLTSPVLPLDYVAFCASLRAELVELEHDLGDRMQIANLLQRLDALEAAARAINTIAGGAEGDDARRIDRALMRASRQLVPLNYTSGNRFAHDSALPHPAWPSLEGLRALARQAEGSPDLPFYAVHARQSRNLVAHALRQAQEALAAVSQMR